MVYCQVSETRMLRDGPGVKSFFVIIGSVR